MISFRTLDQSEAIRARVLIDWCLRRGPRSTRPAWVDDAAVFEHLYRRLPTETDHQIASSAQLVFGGKWWTWFSRTEALRRFLCEHAGQIGLPHERDADGRTRLLRLRDWRRVPLLWESAREEWDYRASFHNGALPRLLSDPQAFAVFFDAVGRVTLTEAAEELVARFGPSPAFTLQSVSRAWIGLERSGLAPAGVPHRRGPVKPGAGARGTPRPLTRRERKVQRCLLLASTVRSFGLERLSDREYFAGLATVQASAALGRHLAGCNHFGIWRHA